MPCLTTHFLSRPAGLYARRNDELSLYEVECIAICGLTEKGKISIRTDLYDLKVPVRT